MTRRLLCRAVLAALVLPLSAQGVNAAPLTNVTDYPPAEAAPAADPYRWMETRARASEVRAWLARAGEHTRSELGRMPGFEPLVAELLSGSAASALDRALVTRGGLSFRLRLGRGDSLAKLVVRDGAGAERVLYDPAAAGGTGAINNYSVSPDGRRVAIHTALRGAEVGMIRVIDVPSGRVDPRPAGPVWGENPATWIGNDAFLYTQAPEGASGSEALASAVLKLRRVDAAAGPDPELLRSGGAEGLAADELFASEPETTSPWTLVLAGGAQAERRVLVARDAALGGGAPGWRDVAGYARRVTTARLLGDDLYVITAEAAANGEVRRINLASGREELVLAAGDMVLQNLIPTEDGLYVVGLSDGFERLYYMPASTRRLLPVSLPVGGAVDDLRLADDRRSVTLAYVGWLTNRTYYRVERGRPARLDYASGATPDDLSGFEVLQEQAISRDGARVPLTILAPRNLAPTGSAVAVLDAYGGYGDPVKPFYRTEFHVWLKRGGVSAFCGVRGGGDKGRTWHEGGRAGNKPNAQQDFVACAERLVQLRLTTPSKLVAHAASNGALVVGPAVLQRPDLFRGAVIRKGMLNATRIASSGNGPNHYAEMGDPRDPAGLAGLERQDAYLALDRATAAPDLLLSVGLNDSRVEPWFSAKFAAKALARFGAESKVLVAAFDSGHSVGDTREQLAREAATVMGFALSITGDPAFQVGPAGGSAGLARATCARSAASPAALEGSESGAAPARFAPDSPYRRRRC